MQRFPIIAIIGRPNVGKSTLFNRLTKSRDALVAEEEGLTRDRKYGYVDFTTKQYNIVDTGGITYKTNIIDKGISLQVQQALAESDIIYFIASAKEGIHQDDIKISQYIRTLNKPILVIINKSEGLKIELAIDFYELGLGEPILISAEHNQGLDKLIDLTLTNTPQKLAKIDNITNDESSDCINIAVLGKPNVGKSTLINKILGENRVLASDIAGTTRDSISINFEKNSQKYTLVDTAGIRKKSRVDNKIEKFSIIKSIETLEKADVVLLILDAHIGITEQDATLLGMIVDKGRSLLIIINKWDGLDDYQKEEIKRKLDIRLSFINYASIHYISALHGSGIGKLFLPINKAYQEAKQNFSTSLLNRFFTNIVNTHQPPLVKSRRIKLKYIHQITTSPPTFAIHGNQVKETPKSYQNYLINSLRRDLNIKSTPIKLEFRNSTNPFKDRKNELNHRQISKKRRMMKFVKKK